jgi:hypothetical protein
VRVFFLFAFDVEYLSLAKPARPQQLGEPRALPHPHLEIPPHPLEVVILAGPENSLGRHPMKLHDAVNLAV